MQRFGGAMHGLHHALEGLRARDAEQVRESAADRLGLGSHAARDDDLTVLGHGVADGRE